eukprot:1145802-Pelagomonas_calceolata.AAC.5
MGHNMLKSKDTLFSWKDGFWSTHRFHTPFQGGAPSGNGAQGCTLARWLPHATHRFAQHTCPLAPHCDLTPHGCHLGAPSWALETAERL